MYVATGNSRTAETRETTAPGHSHAPPTQPSVTPATSRATSSTSTGAVEGGRSTRGRRGRPRGSGKRNTSDENWERSHHEPEVNPSTWKLRGSLGPCRRKGWRWREGKRGRRERRVSTRERNSTSIFHCGRPQRYELWGLYSNDCSRTPSGGVALWTSTCNACAVHGVCGQTRRGAAVASLRSKGMHSLPWKTGSNRSGSSGRPWTTRDGSGTRGET